MTICMKKTLSLTAVATVLALGAGTAWSQGGGYYFGGSLGFATLDDASNDGALTSDFTTGEGTTIPAGTVLTTGTGIGWETEYDGGYAVSGQAGLRNGALRFEAEIFTQSNEVDTHTGVSAGGLDLSAEDAAVLITGQTTNLGVTVADLVADGRGEVRSTGFMANAYYDFDTGTAFTPYLGAGIGLVNVDIDYSPSGTVIINDDQTVFGYQLMAGVSAAWSQQTDIFAGLRYRATDSVDVTSSLLPADFEIDQKTVSAEVGLRFNF